MFTKSHPIDLNVWSKLFGGEKQKDVDGNEREFYDHQNRKQNTHKYIFKHYIHNHDGISFIFFI